MLFDDLSESLRRHQPREHVRRLWRPDIGCQLLFAEGEPIRVPHGGDTQPHFDDTPYHPPLETVEAFGVSGWRWADRRSEFVTFDLDSIANHGGGLPQSDLDAIVDRLKAVPEAEIVRSKSGLGYHVRIYFEPAPRADTHKQHQTNGQRALTWLAETADLPLQTAVDCCGVMAWIWHRQTGPQGFELIKSATAKLDLTGVPYPQATEVPKHESCKRGPKHRELIAYLQGRGAAEWDDGIGCLRSHTAAVKEAVDALGLKGDFETVATGKDLPPDRNCYLFPQRAGAWSVIRYHKGAKEADTWHTTANGWTACHVNKPEPMRDPAEKIVKQALEADEFFHGPDGAAYVETLRRGRKETLPVASDDYRRILRIRSPGVPKCKHLRNAIEQLDAYAIEEGPEYPVYVRLAGHGGKLYLDMGDADRRVIEVDGEGYRFIADPPVRFCRTDRLKPLPAPESGGTVEALRPLVNVDAVDWPLFVGALLGMYHPSGPYPVVSLVGGDGHAKTSLARRILALIDPNIVEGAAPPKTDEDLMLAARQRWVVFLDNISEIQPWLSDAFCRLSTGGAHERRTKYKDSATSIFIAKRPILITSIRDVIAAPDLASRTIRFELPKVETRKTESQLAAEFQAVQAKVFGALLTGISTAIRNLPNTKVADLPRLADFALWVQAAEPGVGLEEGSILNTYREVREAAIGEILSTNLAQKLIAVSKKGFKGTGRELAAEFGLPVSDKDTKDFVAELRTLASALESRGVRVKFGRLHGRRSITITSA